jgi:nucleoside 2-deoxyribosyltransferase
MKVYIAAKFSRLKEMQALVPLLRENNISVTSRWLQETCSPHTSLSDLTPFYHRETAIIDLEDIDSCDAFLFFSEESNIEVPRGGRHVEFGYALAKNKRMIVIGGEENTFHFLPHIVHYSDVLQFLENEGIQNVAIAE